MHEPHPITPITGPIPIEVAYLALLIMALIISLLLWKTVERQKKRKIRREWKHWKNIPKALRAHGVSAPAAITASEFGYDGRLRAYFVTYQYTADGTDYTNSEIVSEDMYLSMDVGAITSVVYDPDDPNTVQLSSSLRILLE